MIAQVFSRLFGAVQSCARKFSNTDPRSMSLTPNDVRGIAHLARLAISDSQLPVYVDSLSKILSFVEQLNAADTAAVEPMAHPLAEQVQRMRPDEVLDSDQHQKYQRNAPLVEAGLYLVPKVIE
jgi:aspartyl-tRNA(Asn)/glutamyl-tRNA(Gln) amidotransferase subunit C